MNEILLPILVALLLLNLPKIFGYIIKGLGLKKIELTFSEDQVREISLLESKNKTIQDKAKRNYLTKKKAGKLK